MVSVAKTTFARAIKNAETGSFEGNYRAVRGLVRKNARLVGAYGIPTDMWPQIAEYAGYPGARWQDPKAQDAVAQATFDALYSKYGDWRLVAIAWKAGEDIADAVVADPSLIHADELAEVRAYAQQVMRFAQEDVKINQPTDPNGNAIKAQAFPVNTKFAPPEPDPDAPVPARTGGSAQNTLVGMLKGMKQAQLSRMAKQVGPEPGETPPVETMEAV